MSKSEARRQEMLAGIPGWYNGYVHFVLINVVSLAVLALLISALQRPTVTELAAIPAILVFANFVEWWFHRGPMHRPAWWIRQAYEFHAQQHHVVFTEEDMPFRDHRELKAILGPPGFLPTLILLTFPVPLALGLFVSMNMVYLYLACAVGYYVVYEWLHTAHHWPPESRVGRLSLVRWLRHHHARHHNLRLMTKGNFNVSFPLADWVLGTVLGNDE